MYLSLYAQIAIILFPYFYQIGLFVSFKIEQILTKAFAVCYILIISVSLENNL